MTRPLRSTRITRLHSYHGAVRPCATHRYSAPHGFARLRISRPRPTAGSKATGQPRARGDRFPRSTPEPRPSSRRLHAGHHLTNQQAPVRLNPGATALPRFRCHFSRFDTSSAVHSRSPSWPTPDALKDAPFPQRSAPRLFNQRTLRWLAASPCRATAEDHQPKRWPLHLQCSTASRTPNLLHRSSFNVRGHTAAPGSPSCRHLCRCLRCAPIGASLLRRQCYYPGHAATICSSGPGPQIGLNRSPTMTVVRVSLLWVVVPGNTRVRLGRVTGLRIVRH